jgi:hypothetical protein
VVVLLFRLLNLSPKLARMFRDFAIGFAAWTHADLDAVKKWFESVPQQQQQIVHEQPIVGEKIEALFVVFQQQMDTHYELMALKREMLTLPALPDEGY